MFIVRMNAPKHPNSIFFCKVALLANTLKEFSTNGELKSEEILCARLEPFVKFDLNKKTKADRWDIKRRRCAVEREKHNARR